MALSRNILRQATRSLSSDVRAQLNVARNDRKHVRTEVLNAVTAAAQDSSTKVRPRKTSVGRVRLTSDLEVGQLVRAVKPHTVNAVDGSWHSVTVGDVGMYIGPDPNSVYGRLLMMVSPYGICSCEIGLFRPI